MFHMKAELKIIRFICFSLGFSVSLAFATDRLLCPKSPSGTRYCVNTSLDRIRFFSVKAPTTLGLRLLAPKLQSGRPLRNVVSTVLPFGKFLDTNECFF